VSKETYTSVKRDLFSPFDFRRSGEQGGQLREHLRLHLFDLRELDLDSDKQVALVELRTRKRPYASIAEVLVSARTYAHAVRVLLMYG